MIITKSMNERWLSNSWLVGDKVGGHAVLIDTGGPTAPIREALERHRLTLTHVLCTHHHLDHVLHNADYQRDFGCPICAHRAETRHLGPVDLELADSDELVAGDLHVRALHVPGHTAGQLSFLINDEAVFTGDTLFRGSVGGTRGPGHTSFEDIRSSIMETLLRLPKSTEVYPGHMEPTTVAREWEENPFVRAWRGIDAPLDSRCTAFGEPATMLLTAQDYDGGTKCWVRFDEGQKLDLVPGSQVKLA